MSRILITLATLLVILCRLKAKLWPSVKRKLIWSICFTMFVGLFHVGEILAIKKDTHIKGGTFTGNNIKRGSTTRARRNFIQVKLDNLKEDQARFRTEGKEAVQAGGFVL